MTRIVENFLIPLSYFASEYGGDTDANPYGALHNSVWLGGACNSWEDVVPPSLNTTELVGLFQPNTTGEGSPSGGSTYPVDESFASHQAISFKTFSSLNSIINSAKFNASLIRQQWIANCIESNNNGNGGLTGSTVSTRQFTDDIGIENWDIPEYLTTVINGLNPFEGLPTAIDLPIVLYYQIPGVENPTSKKTIKIKLREN